MKTIKELQAEVSNWSARFGPMDKRTRWTAIGILEECGEFARAVIKSEHGQRGGTPEYWLREKQDAIADSLVFLLDHCTCRGWDLTQLINEAYCPPEVVTFKDVQTDHSRGLIEWRVLNPLMDAVTDEVEDLSHYLGSVDAVDIILNWATYCENQGWDLQEIVERVWEHVRTRDAEKRKVEG
jgi:hypothetical protein